MRSPESSFHKPFDRIVKAFADEAPRLFLSLLGMAPEEAVLSVTPLRPETAPSVVLPDYVAVLAVEAENPFTFHVEFQLDYYPDVPARMARYGASLAWQYGRRVVSVLLLIRRDDTLPVIPELGEYIIGETRTTHPFRVVRVWDVDAGPILESHDPHLLPWTILMKLSDSEARRVASAVGRLGDEESVARFLTLGSLRYDRDQLEEMLGGARMGLVEVILEGSSLVREVRAKAAEEGRAEGKAEGKAEEARRLLRRAIQAKYPGLEGMPEIDAISRVESLESLLIDNVLRASDAESVKEAIRAASIDAASR